MHNFVRQILFIVSVISVGATGAWSQTAHAQLLTGFSDVKDKDAQAVTATDVVVMDQPVVIEDEYSASPPSAKALSDTSGGGFLTGHGAAHPKFYSKTHSGAELDKGVEGTRAGYSDDADLPNVHDNSAPVDLQADILEHDEAARIVRASGNVMLVQAGRILRADQIEYFLIEDRVVAQGNVVLNEESGDIYIADLVELNDGLKDGFVTGLKTLLVDGSRFTAEQGTRKDGVKTVMRTASYTPCEPCKEDPEKDPDWQIKASKVTHNADENRISYNNAYFEFFGVPVAYTPYFSHPDGTVKSKSGLVSPTFGYDSDKGFKAGADYYWAIDTDKDASVGIVAFTDENPLFTGQWRQRWDNASVEFNGGVTYSGRYDQSSGIDFRQDEELRGHVLAEGLWDINQKWRSGLNIEYASDDQYMRQYDFSTEDVLESQIYAERFSGRHYAAGRLITFQDIRVRDEQEDQPEVLPEIVAGFIGEPGAVPLVGGRWDLEGSFLGLRRDGDEQDVNRASLGAGWERRLISDVGLVSTLDLSLRGDAYNVRDRSSEYTDLGLDSEATETRFFPQAHFESSYPVARPFDRFQLVVEPSAAITVAPNLNDYDDIPNEDSQDVQIDVSNLFEPNRFPGYDLVEDQSHATYGLRTGVHSYNGSAFEVFVGQSYRFDKDGNPFPDGSGLNQQNSDYVGQVAANYGQDYQLNYKFQLSGDQLSSERHEIDAYADFGRLNLSTQYLFAKALEGTDIDESREQIAAGAGYQLTNDWRVRTGATHDLGDDPGLRYAYAGLDYSGQCWSWSLTAERNLTDDTSGDSNTEVFMRIGLKNLGEFETSAIEFSSSSSSSDTEE